jgi:hypothetical protein
MMVDPKLFMLDDSRKKSKSEVVQKQKQEYKMFRHIHTPGLTLYMYNPVSGELKKAFVEAESDTATMEGKATHNRRVEYNPKFIYFEALNQKNADRKSKKIKARVEQYKKENGIED